MSITTSVSVAYKADIIQGVQNVTTDVYKVALYQSTATLDASTLVYTTSGECTGTNYTAGGITMPNPAEVTDGTVAILTFDNATFSNLTISDVGGCMIYNSSQGNATVACFNFGSAIALFTSDFTLVVPAATSTTGLIRLN